MGSSSLSGWCWCWVLGAGGNRHVVMVAVDVWWSTVMVLMHRGGGWLMCGGGSGCRCRVHAGDCAIWCMINAKFSM